MQVVVAVVLDASKGPPKLPSMCAFLLQAKVSADVFIVLFLARGTYEVLKPPIPESCRWTAEEALHHPWLYGAKMQGKAGLGASGKLPQNEFETEHLEDVSSRRRRLGLVLWQRRRPKTYGLSHDNYQYSQYSLYYQNPTGIYLGSNCALIEAALGLTTMFWPRVLADQGPGSADQVGHSDPS